jgi:hypothetical protein
MVFKIQSLVFVLCLGLLVHAGLAKKIGEKQKKEAEELEEFAKNADVECIRGKVLGMVDNPSKKEVESISCVSFGPES